MIVRMTGSLVAVEELSARRRTPFAFGASVFIAICVAVIALPDSFLVQIERYRPLNDAQAGWAYRLLALFAAAQVVYAGGWIFRIERVAEARERDRRLAQMPKPDVISSLARTAAALTVFTLIYGIASIALTGLRGGFWLFPLLAVAQGAWYYREIGQIATWDSFQPERSERDPDLGRWQREPPDYCPPIARALKPIAPTTATPPDRP